MSHSSLADEIRSKYQLLPYAIQVQRAVIIGAQTKHHEVLGVRPVTNVVRQETEARCWSLSMREQDRYSRLHPLESVELESRRTRAMIAVASLNILDRINQAGIEVHSLQTPDIYLTSCGGLFLTAEYEPLQLIEPSPLAA